MNKYERIYLKAAEKKGRAHWLDAAIAPLAVDLEERTGEPVEISGPFGLRAEVYIKVGEKRFINVTPEFPDGGFRLYYDTGRMSGDYQPGTLGDFNGMNNIREPLPDTLDEIIGCLRSYEDGGTDDE